MPQWYYGSSAGQTGPVEEYELRNLIQSGGVSPETLVWREGMKDWTALQAVPELGSQSLTPYAPPGAPGYPQPYYPPVAPTSGLAIASMVCGIVGIILCYLAGLLGLPAVICGHMAMSQMRSSPVPMAGRGMAVAGLVLGYIDLAITVASIAVFVIAISTSHP